MQPRSQAWRAGTSCWYAAVLIAASSFSGAQAEAICGSPGSQKMGCYWQHKGLVQFNGCLRESLFKSAYQEDPFQKSRLPNSSTTVNPEECLLQCTSELRESVAAVSENTCWCSDYNSVVVYAEPEYHVDICHPECVDHLERTGVFDNEKCRNRVGFFSVKDRQEGFLSSQPIPPIVQIGGHPSLGVKNVTANANVSISCETDQSGASDQQDVAVRLFVNNTQINCTTFSQCQASETARPTALSKRSITSTNSSVTIPQFSLCHQGNYTCLVTSKRTCTVKFGCGSTSVWIQVVANQSTDPGSDGGAPKSSSGMATWVKAAVASGVIVGVVIIVLGIAVAYRTSRTTWDPSTSGPAFCTSSGSPQTQPVRQQDQAGRTAGKAPFVSSNTLQRVRESFRPIKRVSSAPKVTGKKQKDQPGALKPRRGLGILRAPPKPPRLGRDPAQVSLAPGYCAVGMTPSTSADQLQMKPTATAGAATRATVPQQNAYAVSNVGSPLTATAKVQGGVDQSYSAITAHPLEPTNGAGVSLSKQALAPRASSGSATRRLNYVDLDLVMPAAGDTSAETKLPEHIEKTCYAAVIPEAHLKGVRRASDGTHT